MKPDEAWLLFKSERSPLFKSNGKFVIPIVQKISVKLLYYRVSNLYQAIWKRIFYSDFIEMAGIFNLFGDSDLNKGEVLKPLSRSKTSLGINRTPIKTSLAKPKGLSIRSNSSLNISAAASNNLNDVPNKQQELFKPKLTQLDKDGCPISPKNDFLSAKPNDNSTNLNDASPKKVINKRNLKSQMPSEDTVFKKPFSPKKYTIRKYPEPENLAPYYDMQFEFDDIYTKPIKNEFKELLMKKKNELVPYEDEGFESDPELLDYKLPTFRVTTKSFDDEWRQCKTPNLPEISDDENYF